MSAFLVRTQFGSRVNNYEHTGIAACNARPECFLVGSGPNGTALLYGGMAPGKFSEVAMNVYNTSSPELVLMMRLAPSSSRVSCLVGANASDLISINVSPPYNDDFFTDAEVRG